MNDAIYKQALSLLYNPEMVSIPIPRSNYTLHIHCVDMLGGDAVGFPHCHDSHFEIYYMISGTLDIIVEQTTLRMHDQDYLIVAPGVVHHTLYDPLVRNKYYIMVFDVIKTPASASGKPKEPPLAGMSELLSKIRKSRYCSGKDYNKLTEIIQRMERESSAHHFGWKNVLYNYYTIFILEIFRNLAAEHERIDYTISENMAMRINRYLNEHYNENITIQEVADVLYCSTRHINRVFKRYFNASFNQTLSRYRVNYAKNYLIETNLSIGEIAEQVGLSTPNTLFRLFKELEGITPGEYRKMHKDKFFAHTSIIKGTPDTL